MKIYRNIFTDEEISERTYNSLDFFEKTDYVYERDQNNSSDGDLISGAIGFGLGLIVGSILDKNDDSNSSSSGDSFDGFGGGDFGGGGASSDW